MPYATLILPLALSELYHYRIPDTQGESSYTLQPGMRVVAPLGPKRFYTGIVHSIVESLPEGITAERLKTIESILDPRPIIDTSMLAMWEWMAHYHQCSLGQVMRAALPSGLLPESQTLVMLTPNYVAEGEFPQIDIQLLDLLAAAPKHQLTMSQVRVRLGRNFPGAFSRLLAAGAIYTEEQLKLRYQPRKAIYIGIAERFQSQEGLTEAEQMLRRAPKQLELLHRLVYLLIDNSLGLDNTLPRTLLIGGDTRRSTLVRTLVGRNILRIEERTESSLQQNQADSPTEAEQYPIEAMEAFTQKDIALLYTRRSESRERYILGQIKRVIDSGLQVLLLTPSAMDCPANSSFIKHIDSIANGKAWPYHPLINEHRRTELFLRLTSTTEPCVVYGTRGAIFLPMQRLGLIIVDEEQEYLYKQQHTAPLYHARNVALWLGAQRQVPVLLSSETPSAEAIFNTKRGKYELITLDTDSEPTTHIPIDIINLTQEYESGRLPFGHSISYTLRDKIQSTLSRGQRVLLLQNRRGYAPYALCRACEERISCPRCSISLTYHSNKRMMRCHYCGYEQGLPSACPNCGTSEVEQHGHRNKALRLVGYGVERIEEEVLEIWPELRVLRIDSDTLQSRRQQVEVHTRLEVGDVDMLIGTQLIKAQPVWENIGLVAVIHLETMISFPDFRAQERTYQLLHQLRLRLGYNCPNARMAIQTNSPTHPFIKLLVDGGYRNFIGKELKEREEMNFAPFYRVTYIRLKAIDEGCVERVAQRLSELLKQRISEERIRYVESPSVVKVDNHYLRQIVCLRPYSEPYHNERSIFTDALSTLHHELPESSRVRIIFDVDPL